MGRRCQGSLQKELWHLHTADKTAYNQANEAPYTNTNQAPNEEPYTHQCAHRCAYDSYHDCCGCS